MPLHICLVLLLVFFSQAACPVDGKVYQTKLCVSPGKFESILEQYCSTVVARRSKPQYPDVVRPARQANTFLTKPFKRGGPQLESEPTEYKEECCQEGCTYEEVLEYC